MYLTDVSLFVFYSRKYIISILAIDNVCAVYLIDVGLLFTSRFFSCHRHCALYLTGVNVLSSIVYRSYVLAMDNVCAMYLINFGFFSLYNQLI